MFSLFSDVESQALALLEFAAERAAGRRVRIAVIPPHDALTHRCESLGWTVVDEASPDLDFVDLWERTPLSDAALSSLAHHMVRELKMGQAPTGTDFLGLSFTSVDLVGHRFGPHSSTRSRTHSSGSMPRLAIC